MKIGVVSHTRKLNSAIFRPDRFVSKNAANALVRRLLAVYVTKRLIQMVDPRRSGLPAKSARVHRHPEPYQHHIEPKIEKLTPSNSEWLAYLEGFRMQA